MDHLNNINNSTPADDPSTDNQPPPNGPAAPAQLSPLPLLEALPPSTLPETPPPSKKHSKKFLLTLSAFALILVAFLTVWVALAFNSIRQNLESATWAIPLVDQEPVSNQIAFVGNDFNVWLVSPDGGNLRRLTLDGKGYRFPTWSPDGRQLAFIGHDDSSNTVLYVSPTDRGESSIVFDEPNSPPFYLYWSPDSRNLTFLTQEDSDIAMRLVDTSAADSERILGRGAPFYWAWSPGSEKLLMHVGGSRAASEAAHLSLLDNDLDAQRVELKDAPGRFQAPVWSSDGNHFFYIAENEDQGESIFKIEADTLIQDQITDLSGFAHMVLSPDDEHLAYLQYEAGTRPPFGRAYLLGVGQNKPTRLTKLPVASMYWSPDGKKLALLSINRPNDGPTARAGVLASPLTQEFSLRWWVYNLETEALQPLISFAPTINFLQTIPYFDQYHQSLTFWSPDSRYLVITKKLEEGSSVGSVWVVDTTGKEKPHKIGDGSLAVWSWQ